MHTRHPLHHLGAVVVLVLASGCGNPVALGSEAEVFLSTRTELLNAGDTLSLVGIAHNRGHVSVAAGRGCSPGIGFLVTNPAGVESDLYEGLDWLCPLSDHHVLEPGETDVVEWPWVPSAVGRYELRATLIVSEGPTLTSDAVVVHVVED